MMVETQKETRGFQAEVKQLLHLMINSLYSNKEIFIRELISNASDAADKLRFKALANNDLYEGDAELKVWIDFDKDNRTLTIRDNGIGMTRDEVINNLGTIAKSGTREFLQTLTGDKQKDSQLIGQFGVGFYSAFIVADKIVLQTRAAGASAEEGVQWISDGEGQYEIETIEKADRGTEITLHLKETEDEFLNGWHLRHVIRKYSDHISLPVMMPVEEPPAEAQEEENKTESSDAPKEEVVNRAQALWVRPKQEISEEEYKEFYKHVAHDFEDPLCYSHNKVEGKQEYISLLYIPGRAPFDIYHANHRHGLKLYVRRVFIMDDAEQFLPNYLRFVRGVIDTNDLPLNISREILQSNRVIDTIRSASIKRILSMMEDLAKNKPEAYQKFWVEFGQVIKEGPAEDFTNRDRVAKLLRFSSTHTDLPEQNVSLEDYLSRMSDKQDKIYYYCADSFNAAKDSPHLEVFRQKGIEVLLLTDRVDEWLMAHLTEFEGKKFQSVAKGGLELGDLEDAEEKESSEKIQGEFEDLLKKIQEVLQDRIKEVRITRRLTESPACIVVDEHEMTPQMERIMRAAGQQVPVSKPILELNPEHALILKLKEELNDEKFTDWTQVIFDQAVLSEGGQLEEPGQFVKRFNHLVLELMGR